MLNRKQKENQAQASDALQAQLARLEEKLDAMAGSLQSTADRLDALEKSLAKIQAEEKAIHALVDYKPNRNIRRRLYDAAGMDTAQYVLEHMNKLPAFKQPLDILPFGIGHAKTAGGGLYLEFGVYSGKTINKIAETVPDRTVYGFDCFTGLPEDWHSGFPAGTFKVDALPQVRENVALVQGLFEDTLPGFVKEHPGPCAFIHVDCDLYSSTKTIFTCLKDRIVSGTVISFDEYFNYPGWREGEYKAFQEFITETGLQYEYLAYVMTNAQVSVRIL